MDDTPATPFPWGNLRIGHCGRVLSVVPNSYGITLLVEGARSGHPSGEYRAIHFRKIRADEREACEPEFVTLLKRRKAPSTKERETRILEALFPESPTERARRSNASRDTHGD